MEIATLAGGCFWGIEHIYKDIPGVVATRVGYMGGKLANPTYKEVKTGTTGHAEVCEVTFDPAKITYREIVQEFLEMHNPTEVDRQGVDVGTQYRTEIFYHSDAQKEIAHEVMAAFKHPSGLPLATKLTPATEFYPAEEYHQKYFVKNPNDPCLEHCHRRKPKH